jgi:GT2 family glycosyltransferase
MPNRYLSEAIPAEKWKGQRAFIIGGGSSLKGFDFEQLRGEKIIAINRAVEYVPFAEIMFALDQKLYNQYSQHDKKLDWEKFESFRGLRVWVEAPGGSYGNDVLLVKYLGKRGLTDDLAKGIFTGGNSGYAALNLAVCLGATTICLLGFDMDNSGNFHSGYQAPGGDPETRGWIDGFNELAPRLEAVGVKVINLNQKSKLQCFPFGELKVKSTITAITPTGDRPLAFALCQRWMMNQTVKPDQWIVVDDGKKPSRHTAPMQYVRRKPMADDPKHTLTVNLRKALPLITGDKIIIWEDDEYYAPDYIKRMVKELDSHDVVGIKHSKYYHLDSGGYKQFTNEGHASFAATAFRSSVLPDLKAILDSGDNPFVDMALWKRVGNRGYLFTDDNPLYLGIKGLPGRPGVIKGHQSENYVLHDTADRSQLKRWIPCDYRFYLDVLVGKEIKPPVAVACDIIVPTYNNEALTIACFESIKKCTSDYRIIWVDNGSTDTATVEAVLEGVNYLAIKLPKNEGFVGAVNRGIAISNSDYVCLLNNDTIVSTGWLDKMIDALRKNQKLGIVGALTAPLPVLARELWPKGITSSLQLKKDYDSHHNIRYIEDMQMHRTHFPEYVNLEDFNRRIEEKFSGVLAGVSFVAFLCAVIKREVIEKVGLLDVNYAMGMYDDNDYDLAVKKAGWETKLLYDTCIMHFGHATFQHIHATENFDDNSLRLRNLAYMKRKWGLK